MWTQRIVTSDAVPTFLKKGGKLDYRPIHTPKGWQWELWALSEDGNESHIISSKTGEPRVFKSADALLAFHMRQFPTDKGLFIPAPTPAQASKDPATK